MTEPKPCKLCGKTKVLQESHVIPAFAVRWMIETSATGFVRSGETPALRVQDGQKEFWLCTDCEQEFAKHERSFCNQLFHPFNTHSGGTYRYGPWMERFCVSVSWRVMHFFFDSMTAENQKIASAAADRWRDFLLYRRSSPGIFKQHIVPLHPVGNALPLMSKSINRYLLRGIEAEYVGDGASVMTYAKVGRFAVFGLVTPPSTKWDRTLVTKTGAILPRRIGPPSWMMEFFSDRAASYDEAFSAIPEAQHDKIEAAMDRNMDRVVASASAEALRHDARLFGRQSVTRRPKD